MNRRNFLKNSALALFGFSVLPPAKTYERIWKAQPRLIINPAYVDAEYECCFIMNAGFFKRIQPIVFDPKCGEWAAWTPDTLAKCVDGSLIKA